MLVKEKTKKNCHIFRSLVVIFYCKHMRRRTASCTAHQMWKYERDHIASTTNLVGFFSLETRCETHTQTMGTCMGGRYEWESACARYHITYIVCNFLKPSDAYVCQALLFSRTPHHHVLYVQINFPQTSRNIAIHNRE